MNNSFIVWQRTIHVLKSLDSEPAQLNALAMLNRLCPEIPMQDAIGIFDAIVAVILSPHEQVKLAALQLLQNFVNFSPAHAIALANSDVTDFCYELVKVNSENPQVCQLVFAIFQCLGSLETASIQWHQSLRAYGFTAIVHAIEKFQFASNQVMIESGMQCLCCIVSHICKFEPIRNEWAMLINDLLVPALDSNSTSILLIKSIAQLLKLAGNDVNVAKWMDQMKKLRIRDVDDYAQVIGTLLDTIRKSHLSSPLVLQKFVDSGLMQMLWETVDNAELPHFGSFFEVLAIVLKFVKQENTKAFETLAHLLCMFFMHICNCY